MLCVQTSVFSVFFLIRNKFLDQVFGVWPTPYEWVRNVQLILIKIYSASYLFMVLVTTLPVAEPTGVHEMNGKGVEGNGSSPIWNIIPTFARRDWGGGGGQGRISIQKSVIRHKLEPRVVWMRVGSITAKINLLDPPFRETTVLLSSAL